MATICDCLMSLACSECLLQSLYRIQHGIPASDLCIQIDLPAETAGLEYERGRLQDPCFKPFVSPLKTGILERVARFAAAVHADVELGYLFCYGDLNHVNFVQPVDAGLLVEIANAIVKRVGLVHKFRYIHMPVPRDRIDEAFFKPLKKLELGDTQLFLGVVHVNDESGTRKN